MKEQRNEFYSVEAVIEFKQRLKKGRSVFKSLLRKGKLKNQFILGMVSKIRLTRIKITLLKYLIKRRRN